MQRRQFLGILAGWLLTTHVASARGRLRAHNYVFVGKMVERSTYRVIVQGPDAHGEQLTIPFRLDTDSKVAANLETGDTVVVHYDYTLQSDEYSAFEVTVLPTGYKAPASTFPDTRGPADKDS